MYIFNENVYIEYRVKNKYINLYHLDKIHNLNRLWY